MLDNVEDDFGNIQDNLDNVSDNFANVSDDLANISDDLDNVNDNFDTVVANFGGNGARSFPWLVMTFPSSKERPSKTVTNHPVTFCRADASKGYMDLVANAVSRPSSGKDASKSRRAGVRSCGENRERRRAWLRPFRRARRAIKSSFELMTCACRAIEAVEKFAVDRPIRAARHLGIASGLMSQADEQLDCAVRGMRKMLDRAAESPDVSLDAPAKLIDAGVDWIRATAELTAFSERLDEVSLWLLDAVQSGAIQIPIEEQTADAGEPVIPFRLIPPPLLPPDWFSYESSDVPSIPSRRPRSVRQPVVEAARRITRGRAPPFDSTCSL